MRYTESKMCKERSGGEAGFTLVELMITIVIVGMIVIAFFDLFGSLIQSTITAQRQSVAVTLATNQMEYLRSLPYGNLAVQGGSIYATTLIPASKTQVVNGVKYTIT